MNYCKEFSSPYSFSVVIHVLNEKQAIENVEIAMKAGVDGLFLINHQVLHPELFEIAQRIKETYPSMWMGINCLDLIPHEIFSKIPRESEGV